MPKLPVKSVANLHPRHPPSDRLEDLSDGQLAMLRTQLHEAHGVTMQLDEEGQKDRSVPADGYQLEIKAMAISTQVDSDYTVSEVWKTVADMEAEALREPDED